MAMESDSRRRISAVLGLTQVQPVLLGVDADFEGIEFVRPTCPNFHGYWILACSQHSQANSLIGAKIIDIFSSYS
jgi:hypothetical protein